MHTRYKNHFVCLLGIFCNIFLCFGFQNSKINTDFNNLSISQLKDAVDSYFGTNINEAERYAQLYLKKATANNQVFDISEAYSYLGKIKYHNNDYIEAIAFYDSGLLVLEKYGKKHAKDIVSLLKNRGQSLLDMQRFNDAYLSYSKALDTIAKYNLNDLIVSLNSNIAMIKSEIADFEGALKLHTENLSFLDQVNKETYASYNEYDTEYIATVLNIATAHRRLKQLDNASKYTEIGLARNEEILKEKNITAKKKKNHQLLRGHLLTNKGIIYFHKNLFNASLGHFDEAIKIKKALKINSFSLECDLFRGKCHLKKGEYNKAILFGKNAIKGYEKKNQFSSTRNLLDAYLLLSESYEELENYKEANIYKEKYRLCSEKHLNLQEIHILNGLENEYKSKNLKTRNQTLKKRSSLFMIAVGILLLLLCIGYLFYKRKIKKGQQAFDNLMHRVGLLEADKSSKILKKSQHNLQIDAQTIAIILEKLNRLEREYFFLDKSYDLSSTAQKIGTNTSYLSAIINQYKAKNFKEYMNELKINHALITLKENTTYRKYAIAALAEEFGYNSTLTFSRAFKKYAALNPSEYIKNLHKSH
jgi:AraC-like DNA-binding protein